MGKPAPIEFKTPAERGRTEIRVELEVITPVFGGGVHVNGDDQTRHQKEPDRITPLRGAAIRGHLRFWWRATHGSACGSIAAMREKETMIWGAASKPAQVRIRVEGLDGEFKDVEVFRIKKEQDGPPRLVAIAEKGIAYGAFPLQTPMDGIRKSIPCGKLHDLSGKANLVIESGKFKDEVEDAIDAWLAFGGIGGRTRRGFGALAGHRVGAHKESPEQLFERLRRIAKALPGVPSLADASLRVSSWSRRTALDCLERGLARLNAFRQGPGVGRNAGKDGEKHPGRSRWPEADEIRQVTRSAALKHSVRQVHVAKYPRAHFGLPIIFHFKDEREGDPKDSRLVPVSGERLASPLILRPVQEAPDRFRALALVLGDPARLAAGVELVDKQGTAHVAHIDLSPAEANMIRPLDGNPDPLDAFLKYFGEMQ